MATTDSGLAQWLSQASISPDRLTVQQEAILQGSFHFRGQVRRRLFFNRLLSHFLLHCNSGLKVAQIARLVGISRPTASHQQGALFQGSDSSRSPPHGRTALWQIVAPLCRPDCRVHPEPPRGHALRRARLHPPHLGRPRLHRGPAPFLQEVRPRSRHCAARARPVQRQQPRCHDRPAAAAAGRLPTVPASVATIPPGQPVPLPHPPFRRGHATIAGAFLLMPQALDWLATAQACFADDSRLACTGLLTSIFGLVVGLKRLFHLDEMEDVGFALLCRGRRCPSRHTVGGWRRHLPWYEVDAFCRRTCPWHLIRNQDALVSFDEHTIPRWTKQVSHRQRLCHHAQQVHALRETVHRLSTCARPVPGGAGDAGELGTCETWRCRSSQQVLGQGRPRTLHALFDAGAGKADADVRALWDLAEQHRNLDVTLRACRYPHRLRAVESNCPAACLCAIEEPGVCVGAPPKEIRLAETQTVLKGETAGASDPHHRLPGDRARSQERSLASPVHHRGVGPDGRGADVPHCGNTRSKPIRVGVHDLDSGRGAVRL